MNKLVPNLPELEVDKLTEKFTDQRTVDQVLAAMFERKPELFEQLAQREKSGQDTEPEFREFFLLMFELTEPDTPFRIRSQIFWEARRRVRLMCGLSY